MCMSVKLDKICLKSIPFFQILFLKDQSFQGARSMTISKNRLNTIKMWKNRKTHLTSSCKKNWTKSVKSNYHSKSLEELYSPKASPASDQWTLALPFSLGWPRPLRARSPRTSTMRKGEWSKRGGISASYSTMTSRNSCRKAWSKCRIKLKKTWNPFSQPLIRVNKLKPRNLHFSDPRYTPKNRHFEMSRFISRSKKLFTS